jgi:hypothetical protein
MTNKNIQAAVLAIGLATGAGLTHAQAPTIDKGLYIGGALGQSEAKEYDCSGQPQCENRGTVGRAFVGYQFARHWSLELAYVDLGQVDAAAPVTFSESIKVRLGEAAILASYPATAKLLVYGKLGAYYAGTTHDVTVSGVSSRQHETNGGPLWGGGLQYFITGGLAVRGEATRYMKLGGGNIGDSDYNAYTIGALWKF